MRKQPSNGNRMGPPSKKAAKKGAKKAAKKAAFKRTVKQARCSKESARRRLTKLKDKDSALPLPKFVAKVNKIAERYLSDRPTDGRVTSEFSDRSVRHYQSRDIIDAPDKEGKEARYRYRHVLQAILTRVLLSDGFRAPAIRDMLIGKTDADYEELLEIESRSARKMAHRKCDEDRQGRRGEHRRGGSSEGRQVFVRLEIEPGIEIHIARDVLPPASREEGEELRERVFIGLRDELERRRRRQRRH